MRSLIRGLDSRLGVIGMVRAFFGILRMIGVWGIPGAGGVLASASVSIMLNLVKALGISHA
jgi:hypothetical protein